MFYKYFILFFCIIILAPADIYASEDSDPFAFDEDIQLDVINTENPDTDVSDPILESSNSLTSQETFIPNDDDPELNQITYNTPPPPASNSIANANSQDLTNTLKNDSSVAEPSIPISDMENTWVGKLVKNKGISTAEGNDNSLEKMVDSARITNNSRKSNASVFDISGIMLRMNIKQVERTMQNRGFRKLLQRYQIPNFIKWRNEEYCRNTGVVGYERIDACIHQKAKQDKHQYIQTLKYAKFDTKEEIEITLTSNFTDNKVYKIEYRSMTTNISGNSPKSTYLRNIKVYDFWKKINQKYGKPDDKENVTWGMGNNKPFMKAATGYLHLEDPMLKELDYTRMSREDQRYLNTDLYSF